MDLPRAVHHGVVVIKYQTWVSQTVRHLFAPFAAQNAFLSAGPQNARFSGPKAFVFFIIEYYTPPRKDAL